MTIKEVIRELRIQRSVLEDMIIYNKDFNPKHDSESLENRMKAYDMAIAVLGKQIPKVEFQGEHRKCICGSFAVGEYCFKCGQKIDWSKVEE